MRPSSLVAFVVALGLSTLAEAANTPKIKYIRVTQSSTSTRADILPDGRVYRMSIVTDGSVAPASSVRIAYGKEGMRVLHVREARHERTDLRASIPSFAPDAFKEAVVAKLVLRDAAGATLFAGTTKVGGGVLRGRWDGEYSDGKEPGVWSGSLEIFATTTANDVDFAFEIGGPKAEGVASVSFSVFARGKDGGYHLCSQTELLAGALSVSRTFGADFTFNGDPVGSAHDVAIRIEDPTTPEPTVEQATIQMIQLPGEGTAPGPILGITANGSGTRSAASNTQQTQQAQLL